ncbi:MAG: hypothetical protein Q8O55_07535 [Dehalococcoidales bacterium]|nr:hypothetical protein [Dehalococcoidales bacterium]
MVRSMISPDTIWLRKTELTDGVLFLVLRVRSNIKQVTVNDSQGGNHVEYEYDEVETKYQAPDTLSSAADVKSLLTVPSADILLKAGKEKAWAEINARPIEELRQTTIKEII